MIPRRRSSATVWILLASIIISPSEKQFLVVVVERVQGADYR
jgi:hypothetical protein